MIIAEPPAPAAERPAPPESPPEAAPLSARERWALGTGYVAAQGPHNVVHVLAHQVLNVSLGLSPALINSLLCVQRAWGAVLDPVFGQFSDNLRTPLGRRRPLLIAAALPIGAGFAALWLFPQAWQPLPLFAYLLAFSLVLYGGMSLYGVALVSLQVEVTTEYHQRTRLAAFLQLCFLTFTIAAQWIYPAVQRLADPMRGLHRMALGVGAFFVVAALLPAFFVRERRYGAVARRQPRLPWRAALTATLRNGPFARLLIAAGAANLGFFLASFLGVYLNYYYIYRGRIGPASVMQGWLGTAFQLAAIGAVFGFRRLSGRLGKKRSFQIALLAHLASAAAKLLLYRPGHPAWQLVVYVLNGVAFAGVSLLSLAMLADVTELDEWKTGRRSEGVYCAVLGWADKLCGAIGILLCGLVFPAIGFDAARGADQSPGTLRWMLLLYALFPCAGALVGLVALQPYALTEKSLRAISARVARRRRLPDRAGRPGDPLTTH